jgi:hypothetical protein
LTPTSRNWEGPARSRVAAVLALGIAAALFGTTRGSASHVPEACTTNTQNARGCVTVSDTPDPVAYSAFDGNVTYLRYRAVVTNRSQSGTLSHVRLTEDLPAGTTCVGATTTKGTASCSGQSATASIGQLKRGATATVDVEVTAPATADPNPPDTTITNATTVTFSSNNPNDPGKDVSATYSETTTVSQDAGQTYCPAGQPSCQVDTETGRAQYGNVRIPNASTDLLATIDLVPGPPEFVCDRGKVTLPIGNGTKSFVCRTGDWVQASVTDVNSGTTYFNSTDPLVAHLLADADSVPTNQSKRNFVVFYQATPGAPIVVIGDQDGERCPSASLPRICNITEEADGSWSVDLFRADNGRMK